jgi:hypothetical protein
MGMTRHVTDIFISPKISALTGCGATDVSKEFPLYPEWIKGFVLKVVFHNHIPDDKRPMALQFMRRAQIGLREYAIACQELSEFVAQGSHSAWDEYFSTFYHFEANVPQAYQAYEYARKALKQDFFNALSADELPNRRLATCEDHDVGICKRWAATAAARSTPERSSRCKSGAKRRCERPR